MEIAPTISDSSKYQRGRIYEPPGRGQGGPLIIKTNTPNKTKLFEDNRGCEKWTRTLPEPNQTKHIDTAYHHIRDWVKLGKLSIVPVATDLQLADAMTKPLPRHQHDFLLEKYCGGTSAF